MSERHSNNSFQSAEAINTRAESEDSVSTLEPISGLPVSEALEVKIEIEKERRYRENVEQSFQRTMLLFDDLIAKQKKEKSETKNQLHESVPENPPEPGYPVWPTEISSMRKERRSVTTGSVLAKVGMFLRTGLNSIRQIPRAEDVAILQGFIEKHVAVDTLNKKGKRDMYHPPIRAARKLPELLGKANDPVETLGRLGVLGVRLDSYTFEFDGIEHVQQFVETPGALDVLEKMHTIGFSIPKKIGPDKYFKPSSGNGNALEVAQLLLEDSGTGLLVGKHADSFRDFLTETGLHVSADSESIRSLVRIIDSPDARSFCTKYADKINSNGSTKVASVLCTVSELSKEGVLADIKSLDSIADMDSHLSPILYGYYDANNETGREFVSSLKAVHPIIEDTETSHYIEKLVDIIGKKFYPNVLVGNMDKIAQLKSSWKEAFTGFLSLGYTDLNFEATGLNEYNVFDCLVKNVHASKESREHVDVLLDPLMDEYSATIGKLCPFNISTDWQKLRDFFDDTEARTALMTPEGIRFIGLFPERGFLDNFQSYAELLKVEHIFELVEKTKNMFGDASFCYAETYKALEAEGILDKVEQMDQLRNLIGGSKDALPLHTEAIRCYGQILRRPGMHEFIQMLVGEADFRDWDLRTIADLPDAVLTMPKEKVLGYFCLHGFLDSKFDFADSPRLRESFFESALGSIEYGYLAKPEGAGKKEIVISRFENIRDSFLLQDKLDELPIAIQKIAQVFENKYGPKGKTLVSLAITAYGIRDEEQFILKMKNMEQVLNLYKQEHIPEGVRVTFGIEYEVGTSMASAYAEESLFGYKKDIELVNRSAGISSGRDDVHEIATKPTDNPYILIAEVKLLQDAGFLDFNFEKYTSAARGYHLSLGGESGLTAQSSDAYFLNNIMTMANLTGMNVGREVRTTRGVYSNVLDAYFEDKVGDRIEMKGMGCDSFEQFERSVMTSYHAGIAMQIAEKYIVDPDDTFVTAALNSLPDTAEGLESYLETIRILKQPITSSTEGSILHAWLLLKKQTSDAIRQHNDSFADSEFNGFLVTDDDTYVDTSEHVDITRNRKLLGNMSPDSDAFKVEYHIPQGLLFSNLKPDLINPFTRINNLFLKNSGKGGNGRSEQQSSVNAQAMLSVMKNEGYVVTDDTETAQQSIFDRGGKMREGYYCVQGASEEMITHKVQIILNKFNRTITDLLRSEKVGGVGNEEVGGKKVKIKKIKQKNVTQS